MRAQVLVVVCVMVAGSGMAATVTSPPDTSVAESDNTKTPGGLAATMMAPPDPLVAESDNAKTLSSKITEVTVYADRARVVRTASANLTTGVSKMAFRKLPGWIDEGSVRMSVTPPTAGELVDVEIRKEFLAQPDNEDIRKAEAAVRDLSDRIGALDDEREVLDAQSRQLDSIRAFSLEKLPKDVAVREIKVDEYAAMVKFISDSMSTIAKAKRELGKKQRELQPELVARQRAVNDLQQRTHLEQSTVIVTLRSSASSPAEIVLTYMLPGATWEPAHDLRADEETNAITLASLGIVSQTTGEDWDGIDLRLSTQRSMDTIRIPELDRLLVGDRSASVQGNSFNVASGKHAKQIKIWNRFNNTIDRQDEFDANFDAQQLIQGKNIITFEKIQQRRGTTAHFAADGAQTIRTDGRPVRVPIGSSPLPAQRKIVATPAVSLRATRTANLTNTGTQPILPGSVLLYVRGAFLGRTETDFVASGESFPVFVGVADQIKLSRDLDRKRSSLSWSGKKKRMQVSLVVTTENLDDQPVALELTDRIPVSETDDIRVRSVEIEPEVDPDTKGLLRWHVTLAAKEKKEFRIDYTVEYPQDLPQQRQVIQGVSVPVINDVYQQINDIEHRL